MSEFTFGSLFAGIGGLDLGLERSGMACRWQIEIDDYCNKVLERHWPDVRRYGDVRECGSHNLAPVDLIVGGFPCTDVSVAGRRAGLAGEQSGLWFEFLRIVEEFRPRWVVIENVPGLLSSNGGRDFATILSGLAECGYMGAWRILDAQNFGVPQRRRRVFLVGHLGDGRAAEVLFEREGCERHTATGKKARPRVADPITASFAKHRGSSAGKDSYPRNLVFQCQGSNIGPMGELRRGSGSVTGGVPFVAHPLSTRPRQRLSAEDNYVVGFDKSRDGSPSDVAGTLRVNSGRSPGVNDGKADNQCLAIGWHENKQGELTPDAEKSKALRAGASHSYQGVAVSENQRGELRETPYSRSVTSGGGKPGQGYPAARVGIVVRRLTPTECERLQGFPDGYSTGQSDTARYRQLGNAVCVPVAEWIGRRILEVDQCD